MTKWLISTILLGVIAWMTNRVRTYRKLEPKVDSATGEKTVDYPFEFFILTIILLIIVVVGLYWFFDNVILFIIAQNKYTNIFTLLLLLLFGAGVFMASVVLTKLPRILITKIKFSDKGLIGRFLLSGKSPLIPWSSIEGIAFKGAFSPVDEPRYELTTTEDGKICVSTMLKGADALFRELEKQRPDLCIKEGKSILEK